MPRVFAGFLLLLALALPAGAAPDVKAYTRVAAAGGVEVKVIYAPPEYFQVARDPEGARRFKPEAQLVFLVTLDTHAGDLMSFDPVANSRLRVRGSVPREYPPTKWESGADGSHHRSGVLIYPASVGGTKVLGPGVTAITLVINNLAGVPARSFEWALPLR